MPAAPTTADDLLPQVVWFKRDLRVQDHAALASATAACASMPSNWTIGARLARAIASGSSCVNAC
jgi:deoxyribodipyrimidine photolyase